MDDQLEMLFIWYSPGYRELYLNLRRLVGFGPMVEEYKGANFNELNVDIVLNLKNVIC